MAFESYTMRRALPPRQGRANSSLRALCVPGERAPQTASRRREALDVLATDAHRRDGNRPKSIAKDHLILDEDEVMVDCRIGAVAPLSDTPGVSGNKGLRWA